MAGNRFCKVFPSVLFVYLMVMVISWRVVLIYLRLLMIFALDRIDLMLHSMKSGPFSSVNLISFFLSYQLIFVYFVRLSGCLLLFGRCPCCSGNLFIHFSNVVSRSCSHSMMLSSLFRMTG